MKSKIITVFEHESIRLNDKNTNCRITTEQLKALQLYNSDNKLPQYSLIHNGIKFCEYVGVLQVGNLTIEVLPKIDRSDKDKWRKILIDMIRKVGHFEVSSSSEGNLKIKKNSILNLYLESFLNHVEKLVHQGLIKKYRKVEANCSSLKGKLVFQQHITKNIIHKERFFVSYTTYDQNHALNQVLFKTLCLVKIVNTNQLLESKVNTLLSNFPEMPDIKVSELFFNKIAFNRKSENYKPAILIAKLLLLNYHPDINKGKNNVLSLMFNMNLLWEKFVYVSLKKYFKEGIISKQLKKSYWKLGNGKTINLIPDIVMIKDHKKYIVDTKWKLPNLNKPSSSDLQQMYAYAKYFDSYHTLLCYPGESHEYINGHFFNEDPSQDNHYKCSVLRIEMDVNVGKENVNISKWQQQIKTEIVKYATTI
jgi:5-methylcytosine-specific restriction enzyme subunit McrC